MMAEAVLAARDVSVTFPSPKGSAAAVQNVSFDLVSGETLGIVGESGSGKTMTALSILGLIPRPGRIASGSIHLDGVDLIGASQEHLRKVRGASIGMVFQEPQTSLHPTLRVGFQVAEAILAHRSDLTQREAIRKATDLLDSVGIPNPSARALEFPHTWSGGMRQRAMIAMAVANRPKVLIADEATTALDVTIQAQVLEVLKEMRETTGAALILITHDLGVVAEVADRVLVMYGGRPVEQGPIAQIFEAPKHPYTAGLLGSVPSLDASPGYLPYIPGRPPTLSTLPAGCAFHPRCHLAAEKCKTEVPGMLEFKDATGQTAACFFAESVSVEAGEGLGVEIGQPDEKRSTDRLLEVKDLSVHYPSASQGISRGQRGAPAVDGISFSVAEGETVGLVGESGCGKTTTARAILRLVEPTGGSVHFRGTDITKLSFGKLKGIRRNIQAVFQDPFGSLNPRLTVEEIVASPLRIHFKWSRGQIRDRVGDLMQLVGLGIDLAEQRPSELSGGQRQRVGIARALALEPALLVLDEPLSALDVSIQAQVLNLLRDLQEEIGLSYLLIAHDLAAVRHLADRVLVMYLGRIVERGNRDAIYDRPAHPYTKALLSAIPVAKVGAVRSRIVLTGDVPTLEGQPHTGCRFASRCFRVEDRCLVTEPELEGSDHHARACYFPLE